MFPLFISLFIEILPETLLVYALAGLALEGDGDFFRNLLGISSEAVNRRKNQNFNNNQNQNQHNNNQNNNQQKHNNPNNQQRYIPTDFEIPEGLTPINRPPNGFTQNNLGQNRKSTKGNRNV
jgi:hypothetical protein